jgi:hypothetical protein
VEGRVDVCVPDDSVLTVFTGDGWYEVDASMTGSDGIEYRFSMLFPHHTSSRKLNLTGDPAAARADANGAWFRYVEIPASGAPIQSAAVTAGSFRLGYSDTEVVAGLFENVQLQMETVDGGESAGTRNVPEGFFSILTDIAEPTTTH